MNWDSGDFRQAELWFIGTQKSLIASREVGGDRISTGLQADEDYPEAVFAARSV